METATFEQGATSQETTKTGRNKSQIPSLCRNVTESFDYFPIKAMEIDTDQKHILDLGKYSGCYVT